MATITASSLSLENTLEELIKEFNNLSSDVESVTLETLITSASSQITFEGATDDDNETTLTATDPTADRTITLPDVTGTVVTTGNADAGATTTTFADLDHFLINDGGTLKKMAIATALSSLPALTPSSANANALGSAALEWSDLFLGDGSVINFGNNQDVTLTHVADTGLTLNLMMVATTFEPSADTAAGDNAAFGYTSVLGAIITGEGSTNDVTLVNDADATVLGIPTGTVNVTMAGTLDVVGDVIGANFQPDGDTATGDNAAIGYTSVLGLILTGEGSTNDVTIVNDADTTVMGVATGTTTVNFAGQVTGTGFTGTLDGVLGSGTAAAATTTTLASTTITASGIIKTDDSTAATSTTDGSLQTDGGLSVVLDAVIGDDIILLSDEAQIAFGVNSEITLAHVHNVGLTLTHVTADDNLPIVLQLKSQEDEILVNEVIGSIEFAAGDSDGTDGAGVAAGIHAIAEDTFSATANATKLVFTTGVSETAASSATAKATLSSIGDFTVAGDLVIKDGGTIGTATDPDAITIASAGVVTISQSLIVSGDLTVGGTTTQVNTVTMNAANALIFEGATADDYETTLTITDPTADRTITLPNETGTIHTSGGSIVIPNAANIGSAGDADSIAIAANGVVTFSQIPVMPANSILESYMAANSVDSDSYVDGSIDEVHMSANSIDSDSYVDGSIDTAHYADDSITEAKMANDSVGSAEMKTLSTLLIKNAAGSTLKTLHGAGA
jgi:hypothetical protein